MSSLFSPNEVSLFSDAAVMQAKNSIIQKMVQLFGRVAVTNQQLAQALPKEYTTISPKISKGESYLGLPYVVLDYPRNFAKADTMAIRSLFWWGNHFSVHLLLSGNARQIYESRLQQVYHSGGLTNYFVGVNTNPWQHHFLPANYLPVQQVQNLFSGNDGFIKLAKKIPLQEWDNAEHFFEATFGEMIGWLIR